MSDDDDVKDLLSRAFGQEPPLGIDRDEVLQQGRKRLRRRRFAEAGSVVALVVVVAVGAATLTHFAGTEPDRKMPPAASSTEHAPPGPDLPLTTPSSVTQYPPRMTTSPDAEQQLTTLLYSSGIINEKNVSPVPGQDSRPKFRQMGDQFVFEADLDTPDARGYVEVMVDFSPNMVVGCDNLPKPNSDCEVRDPTGKRVTVYHFAEQSGERIARATTVSSAGVWLSASASNLSRRDRADGRKPTGTYPVLSDDDLCVLVTKAGLGG